MKKSVLSTVLLLAFTLFSFKPALHTDIFKVNTDKSTLEWAAAKLTGKHNGTIRLTTGQIMNDHGQLHGFFEIDMRSIKNTDLTDEQMRTKLEGHLKSPDFFDVEKFPKATFTTTTVTPFAEKKEGGYTHRIKGNLTIKDKTNEIEFDAIISIQGTTMLCNGTALVDRSKFDVKYGSKSFYEDIGDKVIYDEFTLKINLVAQQ